MGVRVRVFNHIFNNISLISWRSLSLVEETEDREKTTNLPQVTDKLHHIRKDNMRHSPKLHLVDTSLSKGAALLLLFYTSVSIGSSTMSTHVLVHIILTLYIVAILDKFVLKLFFYTNNQHYIN